MLEKIGIREFRNNLAKYISATEPVAVMRYGQTVGYFLPTPFNNLSIHLQATEAIFLRSN